MPQPLSRVVPNATVSLTPDALSDKPDMAIVVTQIFAMWAHLELALALILIRLIGGDQEVALAIYSMLETQTLKQKALLAAAKEKLNPEDNDVLVLTLNVANGAATPRNQLAHWPWAVCQERHDLLLLVNPKSFKERELMIAKAYAPSTAGTERIVHLIDSQRFDHDEIQTYGIGDLRRSLRDIEEAHRVLSLASNLFDANSIVQVRRGTPEGQEIRDQLLQQLNSLRLFREAAARLDKGRNSTPPKTNG
jgi:hypothetical protein